MFQWCVMNLRFNFPYAPLIRQRRIMHMKLDGDVGKALEFSKLLKK